MYNGDNVCQMRPQAGTSGMGGRDQRVSIYEIPHSKIEVKKFLGAGSYGTVFRCCSQVTCTEVAVKCVRFLGRHKGEDEAAKIYQLAHPNIIRLYGICHVGTEFCCLVMELCQLSLECILKTITKKKDIALAMKWRMATELAEALLCMHSYRPQLLHCDLKSGNILLTSDLRVKLCDFGLSMWKRSSSFHNPSRPRGGTITHMAPELFSSVTAKQTDKCDVYSYAIVLWEILEVQHDPYPCAKEDARVAYCVQDNQRPRFDFSGIRDVRAPEDIRCDKEENVERAMAQLMKMCWAHDPIDRPDVKDICYVMSGVRDRVFTVADCVREAGNLVGLLQSKCSIFSGASKPPSTAWSGPELEDDFTCEDWHGPLDKVLQQKFGAFEKRYNAKLQRHTDKAEAVKHHITVYTGNEGSAGTDANVYITLHGKHGITPRTQLKSSKTFSNLFEKGQKDEFLIDFTDVGVVESIEIEHDNTGIAAGWFLDHVDVDVPVYGWSRTFPCRKWLDKTQGDKKTHKTLHCLVYDELSDMVAYRVIVHTGTDWGAGTDANVFITMYGDRHTLYKRQLKKKGVNLFENGSADEFVVEYENLGNIDRVMIEHDNSGGIGAAWQLDKVVISNPAAGWHKTFPCNKWLRKKEGHSLSVELRAS